MIHGEIDGYSWTVLYLRCHNNNTAETALSDFLLAVRVVLYQAVLGQTKEVKIEESHGLCWATQTEDRAGVA